MKLFFPFMNSILKIKTR